LDKKFVGHFAELPELEMENSGKMSYMVQIWTEGTAKLKAEFIGQQTEKAQTDGTYHMCTFGQKGLATNMLHLI
jgi:hypothetical protein